MLKGSHHSLARLPRCKDWEVQKGDRSFPKLDPGHNTQVQVWGASNDVLKKWQSTYQIVAMFAAFPSKKCTTKYTHLTVRFLVYGAESDDEKQPRIPQRQSFRVWKIPLAGSRKKVCANKLRKDAKEGGDGIDTLLFDNPGFTSNELNSVHELLILDDHLRG